MKSWYIPKASAHFVAKMEDVLTVYQQPYDPKRPQTYLDEISKALRSTPRGQLSLQPGLPRREDYEYRRVAWHLRTFPGSGATEWLSTRVGRERPTNLDFAQVLRDLVDVVYPDAERIVPVVDNLNIHHPACLHERFDPPRPTSSPAGSSGTIRWNRAVGSISPSVSYLSSSGSA